MQNEPVTTIQEAQRLVKEFAERNGWKDAPNVDKFDHLHEELIEMSRHLRYKTEADRIRYVREHKELFDDGIGDLFFGLCRLANQLDVNIAEAFAAASQSILERYAGSGPETKIIK